jgi:hypothetical protein
MRHEVTGCYIRAKYLKNQLTLSDNSILEMKLRPLTTE